MGKNKKYAGNLNIVLLGNTGNGKSSAGNTIIGEKDPFKTGASAHSVTTISQSYTTEVKKRKITVIDTPDFFDKKDDDKKMESEIVRTFVKCAGGVHAFVIVLKVGRYTSHEEKVLEKLQNMLTGDVLKHTVILFTFGDQLEGKDKSIGAFVKTSSELTKLVEKCENRCHVIDNKYWNKKENKVKNLLKIIDKMVGKYDVYSNSLLQCTQETIQAEMEKLSDKKMSPDEKQENAKENAFVTILKQVAGTATEVFGAFLGNSNLRKQISKSLEHIAAIASSEGAKVALVANVLSAGVTVSAAFARPAEARCKAKNADSAMTSNENAKTLMESAQTALENAKTNLETAITKLRKIQV